MHPLLTGRLRPILYLALWLGIAAGIGAGIRMLTPRSIGDTAIFIVPLCMFYAFVCLSAWWVCRANPLATTPPARLLTVSVSASAQATAVWVGIGALYAAVLHRFFHIGPDRAGIFRDLTVLAIAGSVLYAQSMVVHYYLLSIEAARGIERQLYTSQVTAREAELRALRAQLNPHFLFNSLNSISALVGSDPESARRMCQLLGEFLRTSLSLGARETVPFGEELSLAERYLAVEQVRFGARLGFEKQIAPEAESCLVPPLLIQPLVENAVKHGVADRVEGGTVRVVAGLRGDQLEIVIENPRDPEAPPRRGQGMGLENVRQRLNALDPAGTRVDVFREAESFRVRVVLPAVVLEPEPAPAAGVRGAAATEIRGAHAG